MKKVERTKWVKFTMGLAILGSMAIGFQNCSNDGFTASPSTSLALSVESTPNTTRTPVPTPLPTNSPPNSTPVPAPTPMASPAGNAFHFTIVGPVDVNAVGGNDVTSCNANVQKFFGFLPKTCSWGGGCYGANPNAFGTCIAASPTMSAAYGTGQTDPPPGYLVPSGVVIGLIDCQGSPLPVVWLMNQPMSACASGFAKVVCGNEGTGNNNVVECQ